MIKKTHTIDEPVPTKPLNRNVILAAGVILLASLGSVYLVFILPTP